MHEEEIKGKSSTKVCKYCQSEISKKAKICPNCRKKQGGGCGTALFLGLLAFIFVPFIIGSSVEDEPTKTGTVNQTSTQKATEATTVQAINKTESANVKQEQTESISEVIIENNTENEVISHTQTEATSSEQEQTESEIELDEETYKQLCTEMFYDDLITNIPATGQLVKVHIFASEKYKYTKGSIQEYLVEEITEQYKLELNALACCVMHEETKDNIVPSYMGEHIYMVFQKNSDFSIDTFKTGEKVIIYGEIIQNKNGVYILPKYAEEE